MGNEAGDGVNFTACARWIRERDASRPVHHERAEGGPNTDIVCPMYSKAWWCRDFGSKPQKKPLINCEYAHAMGNSTGNFDLFWDAAFDPEIKHYQGGFIWDWVDQGLRTAVPEDGQMPMPKFIPGKDAKEWFMAYGGDFGFRGVPSDDNFCCNGLVSSDRTPHPAMAHVKFCQQPIKTTFVSYDEKTEICTVKVWNRHDFLDTSDFQMRFRGALPESCRNIDLPTLKPGESTEVQFSLAPLAEDPAVYVTVEFGLKSDTSWAKAGFVVAHDQFLWKDSASWPLWASCEPEEIEVTETPDVFVLKGEGLQGKTREYTFEKKTGRLTSLKCGDVEFLAAPMKPNFWRAPTDNDRGNGEPNRCKVWRNAGDSWQITGAKYENGTLTFTGRLPEVQADLNVTYSLLQSGLGVAMDYNHTGDNKLSEMPRFGMTFALTEGFENLRWFGRGPEETYWDRRNGISFGINESTVTKNFFPYSEPQETGNHMDTYMLSLGKARNSEFLIMGKTGFEGRPWFSFNALHYTVDDLQSHKHPFQMPSRKETYVNVDYLQTGVGGDDSWGAHPLEQFKMREKTYHFEFLIAPNMF